MWTSYFINILGNLLVILQKKKEHIESHILNFLSERTKQINTKRTVVEPLSSSTTAWFMHLLHIICWLLYAMLVLIFASALQQFKCTHLYSLVNWLNLMQCTFSTPINIPSISRMAWLNQILVLANHSSTLRFSMLRTISNNIRIISLKSWYRSVALASSALHVVLALPVAIQRGERTNLILHACFRSSCAAPWASWLSRCRSLQASPNLFVAYHLSSAYPAASTPKNLHSQ